MIAYFDMFSGISGDMTLGALVDLGVPVDWLKKEIERLPLQGFDIRKEEVRRNGIRAVNLFVDAHDHAHARHYADIRTLIGNSMLPERVKQGALAAFETIARAESFIHGTDIETVHFHEVGGIDAIVDIVGTFLGVDYLGIDRVAGSAVPLGSGTVRCSHGLLPVPAPATLEILKGAPVRGTDAGGELVTPTGAAIIRTLAGDFGAMPEMVVDKIGYGAGKRDPQEGKPNLLRIVLGKSGQGVRHESVTVLETSIDDMNPELFGYLMERLFDEGALDVCFLPLQMKKNRPGTRLEVLCREAGRDRLIELILTETTTTGVRYDRVGRAFLERRELSVDTRFGDVKAKEVVLPDGCRRVLPEYEVCRVVAKTRNIPLWDVYRQLCLDMNQGRL